MANDVKALVITGVGLNCEKETAAAFTSSGASATLIHINDLLSGKATMEPYQILAFIGGFSFGDHLERFLQTKSNSNSKTISTSLSNPANS